MPRPIIQAANLTRGPSTRLGDMPIPTEPPYGALFRAFIAFIRFFNEDAYQAEQNELDRYYANTRINADYRAQNYRGETKGTHPAAAKQDPEYYLASEDGAEKYLNDLDRSQLLEAYPYPAGDMVLALLGMPAEEMDESVAVAAGRLRTFILNTCGGEDAIKRETTGILRNGPLSTDELINYFYEKGPAEKVPEMDGLLETYNQRIVAAQEKHNELLDRVFSGGVLTRSEKNLATEKLGQEAFIREEGGMRERRDKLFYQMTAISNYILNHVDDKEHLMLAANMFRQVYMIALGNKSKIYDELTAAAGKELPTGAWDAAWNEFKVANNLSLALMSGKKAELELKDPNYVPKTDGPSDTRSLVGRMLLGKALQNKEYFELTKNIFRKTPAKVRDLTEMIKNTKEVKDLFSKDFSVAQHILRERPAIYDSIAHKAIKSIIQTANKNRQTQKDITSVLQRQYENSHLKALPEQPDANPNMLPN